MRISTLLMSAVGLALYVNADHSDLVAKAIQQSRQRQSSRVASANKPPAAAAAAAAAGKKGGAAQQRPLGQSKFIDVDALNNLIKSFDKTWVHPKAGAKEPVGSNFQYKKTCASIYKARPGACSQLGFGSMCFNYCFEKGEKVSYQCVDASDAAYCKSSSNFDAYLTKYKKDAYKAKAYVHQMISRCFATALCNGQGILDAHPIEVSTPKTREMNHLKLTKPANVATKKTAVKATAAPATATTVTTTEQTEAPAKPVGGKPKKVPEWQKLMAKATTAKSIKEEEEEEEEVIATTEVDGSMEEVEIEVEEEQTTASPSTRPPRGPPARKAASKKTVGPAATVAAATTAATTAAPRATFKPLKTSPAPPIPTVEELAATSHTGEKTPKEDTFWNRFQPNTWYQSIHYLTNTGR